MEEQPKQPDSFIKLFRKAKKNPLFKKPLTFHYFTYCLISAWWSDTPTKFSLGGVEILQAKKTEGNRSTNRPSNRPPNKQRKKVKEESIKNPLIVPPREHFKESHRSKIRNPGLFRQLVKGYLKIEPNDKSLNKKINEKYKLNRTAEEAKAELEREGRDEGRAELGSSEVKECTFIQDADNRNPGRQGRVQNKQRKGCA